MKIHDLKILPEYYRDVESGKKKFEIRKNDRGFHVGDILNLREWNGEYYTGREMSVSVKYILFDWQAGLQPEYCIMSIEPFRRYNAEDLKNFSAILVIFLAIIAAVTAIGLIAGYAMQPTIIIYWMVLTLKNCVDYAAGRIKC